MPFATDAIGEAAAAAVRIGCAVTTPCTALLAASDAAEIICSQKNLHNSYYQK
jgi:hypothetical protein